MNAQPLFSLPFLAATWDAEYQEYAASGRDTVVLEVLRRWASRSQLRETSSESAFIKHFFHDLWGYSLQGDQAAGSYQCHPQFPVARAGQTGSQGAADLALGHFGTAVSPRGVPQVLCEFKDIATVLDAPQNRKGNRRSPVQQCFDYLRESRTSLTGNERVEPQWALVTDMNEFRLYHWSRGIAQCQRFLLVADDAEDAPEALTGATESARFVRFCFGRIFHSRSLLADRGDPYLARLLRNQITHEEALEEDFYREYRAYREHLFSTLVAANPGFPGSKGRLVRLTQRLLDRCLFLLFCEDMGASLAFPPNLYRDVLIRYSTDPLYGEEDSAPWDRLKAIFRAMDRGGSVGPHAINRFNGGLFEPLPDLDGLHIPARVLCAARQGEDSDSLLRYPRTLLYFSAKYNFGVKDANRGRVIDFYALGRIFEQSITELEIMEAEADGRPSLNLLTKRKRDGVYYTPEWVTAYIVEETLGTRLREIKASLGLVPEKHPGEGDVDMYRAAFLDRRRTAPVAGAWMAALRNYRVYLNRIRVVDPACGSGAFLIQSLESLKREHRWVADEMQRLSGQAELWDTDLVVNDILSRNLYGVDINPESVEIAKLALWMHTATRDKPLSSLDHQIQCGNSLVGPDFYALNPPELFSDDERERVNAFDWRQAFPEAFTDGGFDCVVGNPPYVKLQHFRRVQDRVAQYLVNARRPDGTPLYRSTQTGNFDLYLPFVEKGLSLLRPEGRMGFIAPNLWTLNEYGEGLRGLLFQDRRLDRWVDFGSFQVFDEAITYTAIQLFRGAARDAVRCAFAPDGDLSHIDWERPEATIPYRELPQAEPWNLLPDAERHLIDRLRAECRPGGRCRTLEDSCAGITVGIQTSADHVYHLTRLAPGAYRTAAGAEVAIEDGLMRPLVSGAQARRYQEPRTDTYLLFPYDLGAGHPQLLSPAELATRFPLAWRYLQSHEAELRARESGSFDDPAWYRMGRNQNLDKQELPKLLVPRLVLRLFCAMDLEGRVYLDNVDVGGILAADPGDLPYLAGILNSPVANFVWRRTSKPFQNDYRSANKQFIAPLPVPDAPPDVRRQVGDLARRLQDLHTRRRDLVDRTERRLQSAQTVDATRTPDWLWADVGTVASWKASPQAPSGLPARGLTAWAREQVTARLGEHLAELDARLRPGVPLRVENDTDEVRLLIDGRVAVTRYDLPDTPFVAVQWRHALRDSHVTEAFDGKRLLGLLLALRHTDDANLIQAIVALDRGIAAADAEIAAQEAHLNAVVYGLYGIHDPAEIAMVSAG